MTDTLDNQERYARLHDVYIKALVHIHPRAVADVARELSELIEAGFWPKGMHDDACPTCRRYRLTFRDRWRMK